jgi:hypothetical protein
MVDVDVELESSSLSSEVSEDKCPEWTTVVSKIGVEDNEYFFVGMHLFS